MCFSPFFVFSFHPPLSDLKFTFSRFLYTYCSNIVLRLDYVVYFTNFQVFVRKWNLCVRKSFSSVTLFIRLPEWKLCAAAIICRYSGYSPRKYSLTRSKTFASKKDRLLKTTRDNFMSIYRTAHSSPELNCLTHY